MQDPTPLLLAVVNKGKRDIYNGAHFALRVHTTAGETIEGPPVVEGDRVSLRQANGDKTFVAEEDVSLVSIVWQ